MREEFEEAITGLWQAWGVIPTEERVWAEEIARRVQFLQRELLAAERTRLVLGISGGVDSLVAGRLCQLAVEGLREEGGVFDFIALRLPYGTQQDEADAQAALAFIRPGTVQTVDIQPGVDALHAGVVGDPAGYDPSRMDFERGNLKARARMAIQYHVAALNDGLVVGTDHNAEAITGFFTKWGDGACDLLPLRGLNKRQVRELGRALGAPDALVNKPATADLEDLRPQRLDEEALGLSYDVIDDFLEGKRIPDHDLSVLLRQAARTAHKRREPPSPYSPQGAGVAC